MIDHSHDQETGIFGDGILHEINASLAKDKLRFVSIKITDGKGLIRPVKALLDPGSTISAISFDFYCKHLPFLNISPSVSKVSGYCGGNVNSIGTVDVQFQIGSTSMMHSFLIVPGVTSEFLLGGEFFKKFQCDMSYKFETLSFDDHHGVRHSLPMSTYSDMCKELKVFATEHFVIPPQREVIIPGRVEDSGDYNGLTGVTSRSDNLLVKRNVISAHCYVTVVDNSIPVRLYNASSRPVTIWPKTSVCTLSRDNYIMNTVSLDSAPLSEKSAAKEPIRV